MDTDKLPGHRVLGNPYALVANLAAYITNSYWVLTFKFPDVAIIFSVEDFCLLVYNIM
jgi:hypothetical protein